MVILFPSNKDHLYAEGYRHPVPDILVAHFFEETNSRSMKEVFWIHILLCLATTSSSGYLPKVLYGHYLILLKITEQNIEYQVIIGLIQKPSLMEISFLVYLLTYRIVILRWFMEEIFGCNDGKLSEISGW